MAVPKKKNNKTNIVYSIMKENLKKKIIKNSFIITIATEKKKYKKNIYWKYK